MINPQFLPSITTSLPSFIVDAAKEAAKEEHEQGGGNGRDPTSPPQPLPANAFLQQITWLFVLTIGFPSNTAVAYAEVGHIDLILSLEDAIKKIPFDMIDNSQGRRASMVGIEEDVEKVVKLPLRHINNDLLWNEIMDGEDAHIEISPAASAL